MASTYLTRTPSSAGDLNTWTLSVWCKRAKPDSSTGSYVILSGDQSGTYGDMIRFREDKLNFFNISNTTNYYFSNRLYRDISAWYHIVIQYDGANSTINAYVNGEDAGNVSISLNENSSINNNTTQVIGARDSSSPANIYNGSMAHFHFIDGTIYSASTFGETDSTTGIWKPKTNPSVTYGTNGFFLKFENTSDYGEDSSGNNNDWTVAGGTMTQTIDTPSNVFATLNPLYNSGGTVTYANGNTNLAESGNQWKTTFSTLGASSGKYYAEFKAKGNYYMIGVADYNVTKYGTADRNFASTTIISEQGYGYYNGNGDLYYRGSSTTYGATYGNGDIVQVALDCDNNRVFFGKNGTWQNSADPTTPSTGFAMTATDATYVFAVAVQNNNLDCNFGNGYFGTTAVSSAGTNAGVGTFEYNVPSGYKALCTKNINAEEYS
jgi:hypothetical protein